MYKWCTIAPIIMDNKSALDLKKDINLGNEVFLRTAPTWFKDFQRDEMLDKSVREAIINTDFIFVKEYEADNLGDSDLEWKGDGSRSLQDKSQQEILLANFALWLSKPTCILYERYFYNQLVNNAWRNCQGGRIDHIIYNEMDTSNQLENEDFVIARKILSSLCRLNNKQEGNVWFSVIDLFWALVVKKKEIRFIMLWIALESLFGPQDSPQKLCYRMSQRIAFFSAKDIPKARSFYETAVQNYRWRSQLVHGRAMFRKGNENHKILLKQAENLIRMSLRKILLDEELIKTFDGNKRDEYLNNLVFESEAR